jgi:hypothetical protein
MITLEELADQIVEGVVDARKLKFHYYREVISEKVRLYHDPTLMLQFLQQELKELVIQNENDIYSQLPNKTWLLPNKEMKKAVFNSLSVLVLKTESVDKLRKTIADDMINSYSDKSSRKDKIEYLNELIFNVMKKSALKKSELGFELKDQGTNYVKMTLLGSMLKGEFHNSHASHFNSLFSPHIHRVNWIGEAAISEIIYLFAILLQDEYKIIIKPVNILKNIQNSFTYNNLLINQGLRSLSSTYSQIKAGKIKVKRGPKLQEISKKCLLE